MGVKGAPARLWAVLTGRRLLESTGCSAEGRHPHPGLGLCFQGMPHRDQVCEDRDLRDRRTPPRPAFHTRTHTHHETRTHEHLDLESAKSRCGYVKQVRQRTWPGLKAVWLGKRIRYTQGLMVITVSGKQKK